MKWLPTSSSYQHTNTQNTHRNTITHFLWLVRKATVNSWLRLKHIKFIICRWESICVLARQPDESTKLMFYLLWQPCMFGQIVTGPGLCQASRDCLSNMGWVLIKWMTEVHRWSDLNCTHHTNWHFIDTNYANLWFSCDLQILRFQWKMCVCCRALPSALWAGPGRCGEAAAALSRPALEERAECRAKTSGSINNRSHTRFFCD